MKAVLISIKPKWCDLIRRGRKTVEVRKTCPKLEVPFKVYIYETMDGGRGSGRTRADYICPQRGGEGAVRGAVEKILRGDGRWNDAVKKAFQVEL